MMWNDMIGIALFSCFLTGWFEPLNPIRNKIVEKLIDTIVKYNMLWAQPFISVFMCPMCLAFWASLIYTTNLTSALITSLMAVVADTLIKIYSYVKSELN